MQILIICATTSFFEAKDMPKDNLYKYLTQSVEETSLFINNITIFLYVKNRSNYRRKQTCLPFQLTSGLSLSSARSLITSTSLSDSCTGWERWTSYSNSLYWWSTCFHVWCKRTWNLMSVHRCVSTNSKSNWNQENFATYNFI